MSNLYAVVESSAILRIVRAKAIWPQVSPTEAGFLADHHP
jgi:hypothetical protein